MKKLLLISTLGVLPMTAIPALADCSKTGDTVTCSGVDANGFEDASDGLTVNIGVADVLTDDKDALKIEGDGNEVNNDGLISGGDEAIVAGNGLTVNNTGQILAEDKGIDVEGFDDLTVINSGSIVADHKAIRAGDDGGVGGNNLVVENGVGGLIRSDTNEGIESGDNAYVLNEGTIEAFEDGIQVGEDALIENFGDIVSFGDDGDGIDIDSGTIDNYGLISSAAPTGAGIDVDAADGDLVVTNTGTISGGYGILVEDGTHDDANLQSQTIINEGLIEGTAGTALFLAAGEDVLEMYQGSALIGAADFGSGDDLLYFGLDYFDDAIGAFAGGALIDGGDDFDTVFFEDVASTDITGASLSGDILSLTLFDGPLEALLTLTSWENFSFSDGDFALDDIVTPAAVPLPAGVLLLGGALGALGVARRRRRG